MEGDNHIRLSGSWGKVKGSMFRLLTTLARDQRGNVLMITAFCLIPFLALVGSGVDIATAHIAKERLQNACDAGALAGRQIMEGNEWNKAAEDEARKYFDFNFPEGSFGIAEPTFEIDRNPADITELLGHAEAAVPTNIMRIFGFETIDVSVECNAKRDLGHNDIMLVLDVTGSMADNASGGGGKKINRLRTAAINLYKALQTDNNSVTRFGIMPYSHTVNVARSLTNDDFLDVQRYVECDKWSCSKFKTIPIVQSSWGTSGKNKSMDAFRNSGNGCIEERSTYGEGSNDGKKDVTIRDTVSQDDVDRRASGNSDKDLQFGRYDPAVQEGQSQNGCPAEATRLRTYDSEGSFQQAINSATSRVTGGTYHDVGMLWGLRFLSGTGWFAADNPASIKGVPVKRHIVFMTDGKLDTGDTLYSADGVQRYQERVKGSGSLNAKHISRFRDVCRLAKQQATVWVIALDVGNTDDIAPCATSTAHFYVTDGSDLEEVFSAIGQGIGNLRLTR
jgi:hypothetical protein